MKKPTLEELENKEFTQEEINQFAKNYNFNQRGWELILNKYKLNEDVIHNIFQKLDGQNIHRLLKNNKVSEDLIREFKDKKTIDGHSMWSIFQQYPILSEDLIREFQHKVDWNTMFCCQKLSQDFIVEFKDKLMVWEKWNGLCQHQKLTEEFFLEHWYRFDWKEVLQNQKLSEELIEANKLGFDWNLISEYQTLSENFIRKYQKVVNWYGIFRFQSLSEDFMREFKDKRGFDVVSQYQKFSPAFAVEMKMFDKVWEIKQNKQMTEEEKQEIINTLKLVEKMTG